MVVVVTLTGQYYTGGKFSIKSILCGMFQNIVCYVAEIIIYIFQRIVAFHYSAAKLRCTYCTGAIATPNILFVFTAKLVG